MKAILFGAAALVAVAGAAPALADPIAPGGMVTYSVPGTSSIYQIFGHAGDPGGDNGIGHATNALETTFAAGNGNVFTFTNASGTIVTGAGTTLGPDGGSSGTNVSAANGLSGLTGNAFVPLVGVFTSDTDPTSLTTPGTLTFDATAPTGLSPVLDQVFYIGDGLSGDNNPGGSVLSFVAPTGATRLYLGVLDANSFNAAPGYYGDNVGSYNVTVSLAAQVMGGAVPEPASWATMIAGFGLVGAAMRRRRTVAARAQLA